MQGDRWYLKDYDQSNNKLFTDEENQHLPLKLLISL